MKHPSEYTLGELATMVRVDGIDVSASAHDCRDLRNCITALLIFTRQWQMNSAQYQKMQMEQETIRKRNAENAEAERSRQIKKARRIQPFSL